ncbi:MAG: CPBP family intramembrane metalloprotease [Candidatus Atribacteria bacterium]|nr:CPBP family intramembrane metalloprotease [Candidatus Atribacteria bacterium]
MVSNQSFIRRYPVFSYYILTFTISFGGFLLVGGSGLLAGTNWETDPRFQIAVLAMLSGPPIAGILLTFYDSGKVGLRELFLRLSRWRMSAHWYLDVIIVAPLLQVVVLLILSIFSLEFLPAIFRTNDKMSLLLQGILIGIAGGFVEELGWTGFVIPRLLKKQSIMSTGVIVGILWGLWHLLQMIWVGISSYVTVPPTVFLPLYFISSIAALTAYRVLMVRIYKHTESLFLATIMHASYIFSTLFVFASPIKGVPFLIYSCAFTAALWIVVSFAIKREDF